MHALPRHVTWTKLAVSAEFASGKTVDFSSCLTHEQHLSVEGRNRELAHDVQSGEHEGKPEDNARGNFGGYTGENSATKSRDALDPGRGDCILCAGSIHAPRQRPDAPFAPSIRRAFLAGLRQMVDLAGIELFICDDKT
jgi:hypothetical protein